jgi:two-component system NtrC family response regulator
MVKGGQRKVEEFTRIAGSMDTILIVDDEKNYLLVLKALLADEGYEVITTDNASRALEIAASHELDLIITDMRMPGLDGMEFLVRLHSQQPDLPVIMMTAYATVEKAVEAMRRGAFDYITKPFKNEELKITVRKAIEMHRLLQDKRLLSQELQERYKFGNIVGKSKAMRQVYELIEKVAQTKASVLITGESGTGKELIAKAIHYNSPRRDRPFISVNCSALPETLLESELFGHERGAFTGAVTQRKGRFELAHAGTLFLDEVGDMPPSLQVKLLRVLQEMTFERVGGTKTLHVDVRLVTASNRVLREEVEIGRFREDLYYRLKVVHIEVPPLRRRRDDIPLLLTHFLERTCKRNDMAVKRANREALRYLYQYDWTGNVRELENVVERAVILCDGDEIGPQDLPAELLLTPDIGRAREDTMGTEVDRGDKEDGELLPYLGLNPRQVKAVNFIKKNGYITTDYYIQINQISDRHARRDLNQLENLEIIVRMGGGRSTRYVLK